MIFQLKRVIAQWLFPDLLEELTSKDQEIANLNKHLRTAAEKLANEKASSALKLKELTDKIAKTNQEKWSTQQIYDERLKVFVESHYEQIRQKVDEVIYDRYMSLHRHVESFVLHVINPAKTIHEMTRQTYRDVAAQMEFYIKDHDKPGTITLSKPAVEYPIEDVQIMKIRIPDYVYHVRLRASDIKQLREIT